LTRHDFTARLEAAPFQNKAKPPFQNKPKSEFFRSLCESLLKISFLAGGGDCLQAVPVRSKCPLCEQEGEG